METLRPNICGVVTRRTSVSPNFNALCNRCPVSALRGQALPLQTSTELPGLKLFRQSGRNERPMIKDTIEYFFLTIELGSVE